MRLENLILEACSNSWSTSALVFLDPLLMLHSRVYPGRLVWLEVEEECYPVKLGPTRLELLRSRKLSIDAAFWQMIPNLADRPIRLNLGSDNSCELFSATLNVDREALDRLNQQFERAVRKRRFPAKAGYHLSMRVMSEQVFFRVIETRPPRGGYIGNATSLFLSQGEFEAFKMIRRLAGTLEEVLRHNRALRWEINQLLQRQRVLSSQERKYTAVLASHEIVEADIARMEARIEELNEKIRKLREESALLTSQYEAVRKPESTDPGGVNA